MTAVHHLGCLKVAPHTLGDPYCTYTSNLVKILEQWLRYAPRVKFKAPPGSGILIAGKIIKFVIKAMYDFPSHLKYVVTLHWEVKKFKFVKRYKIQLKIIFYVTKMKLS